MLAKHPVCTHSNAYAVNPNDRNTKDEAARIIADLGFEAVYLTGVHPFKTDGSNIRAGVSIDQLVASRVGQPPTTKLASHTNLCLVNVSAQGKKAVVTAALDNLVKGASGQGVECFNIAFGFDRTTALEVPAQWP